ncbi:Uma2 family endonuclease [Baaleninema simplex]|uniref:Uma2 family endonuclease n=1 Tax=Baaleninema simplex TaxID=2862350 RepID=UPI00034BEC64|nr:Uma2 family endonuclease [Baaleninema simplex]
MVAAFDSFEMTASEYLTWEPLQDLRYEFINGQVVAMTGGTIADNDIALNLNDRLRAALRPKGCRVNVADVKVQVEATGNYFYPDVIVSCDDRDRTAATEIRFPELLVEVLSPATEAKNRGRKWENYRQLPTLQEYLLVNTSHRLVERFRRQETFWTYRTYSVGEVLELESVGLSVAVEAIYAGVTLDEDDRKTQTD